MNQYVVSMVDYSVEEIKATRQVQNNGAFMLC